uniref:Peptidoglycan recognition protein family domain-containing protein n=1 Tax=Timema bartmani TaxID=61472 RepID=A0A7R9EUV1_9NEOP|nr:unnamed protein product [Timema bartmani]
MSNDVIVDLPMPQHVARDRDTEVLRSSTADESRTNAAYSDSDSDSWEDQANVDQDEGVQHEPCDLDAALQASTPTSVYMEGSRDVQIGSRLHYNAPVTINQYVHVLRSDSETQKEVVAESRTNANNNNSCSLNNEPQEYTPGVTVTTVKPPLLHRPTYWGLISGAVILVIAGLMFTVYYFKTGDPSSTYPPPAEDMPVLPFLDPPGEEWSTFVQETIFRSAGCMRPCWYTDYNKEMLSHSNKHITMLANTYDDKPNSTLPNGHRIISKSDWRGRPPKYVRPLVQPTPYVVITHTAGNRCSDFNTCATQLRNIQDQHVGENNMPDIGYNFCVGDDGNIYVGRGWDVTNMLDGWVRSLKESKSLPSRSLQESKSLPSKGLQESKSLQSKGRQENKSLLFKGLQETKSLPSKGRQENKSLPYKGLQESKSLPFQRLQERRISPPLSQSQERRLSRTRLVAPEGSEKLRRETARTLCHSKDIEDNCDAPYDSLIVREKGQTWRNIPTESLLAAMVAILQENIILVRRYFKKKVVLSESWSDVIHKSPFHLGQQVCSFINSGWLEMKEQTPVVLVKMTTTGTIPDCLTNQGNLSTPVQDLSHHLPYRHPDSYEIDDLNQKFSIWGP